ncbi:12146_t:CDS:2 [Cetraspora pellucida]|uniref:12146_t:CDS:1 n=1 Tax=Cetraspora pellucida TaxID=1433469 RepID=A0ACA9LP26_9GLOM|nr:12146_t:CDS:2 [Cetraspora pellucida]
MSTLISHNTISALYCKCAEECHKRAEEYLKLCRHDEALTDFYIAFRFLNIFLDAFLNNKVALRLHGEVIIDILTELLKMNPNDEKKILNIRALAYTKISKYVEALVNLNRLLEINTNNEKILSIRAQAYIAIRKNDKALVDLTRL